MKVIYHKEVEVKRCDDCPYCKKERTMEGLFAYCMKMKELGCEPYENMIGGWRHSIYECIDEKCPIKNGERKLIMTKENQLKIGLAINAIAAMVDDETLKKIGPKLTEIVDIVAQETADDYE